MIIKIMKTRANIKVHIILVVKLCIYVLFILLIVLTFNETFMFLHNSCVVIRVFCILS